MTDLPRPVTDALDATNTADLPRFLAAFAEDGVVDDGGRAFRGHAGISRWSRTESIGVRQTFAIGSTSVDGDRITVRVTVGGGGYTGPAVFTFVLSPDGTTVQSLTITD